MKTNKNRTILGSALILGVCLGVIGIYIISNQTIVQTVLHGQETTLNQEPTVPLYPVEAFFASPDVIFYHLAPDGENLLFLSPVNGINNVFRRHINTGEVYQLTFEEEQSILHFNLKGDTVLFLQDQFGDQSFNIFRMNEDGTSTNLTPYPVHAWISNMLESSEEEILIGMNREDPLSNNIYRLNVLTGEIVLVAPDAWGLIFDNAGVPRILSQGESLIGMTISHRYNADDDFEIVMNVGFKDVFLPQFFDTTNTYMYALSNIGRETTAVVRIDPATGAELEVLFEHERVDANLIRGFNPGTIAGFQYTEDYLNRIHIKDLCEVRYLMQMQAEAHFSDGEIVSILRNTSSNRNIAIVWVGSDVCRGRQYFFNKENDTMTLLVDFNSTNPGHMAPMTSIRYTARDGLEIQGYLTIPVGVEPYNLPVVVLPHGGPWFRDHWEFNEEVQFLANRGYAVFQPNFRGSDGFGRSFLEAGSRQWGLSIQDDITDGVLWLIEQGIADPNRVAIFGSSFGGYAALAGATFTPELFAAAISMVGISNIFTFLESIPPWWEEGREMFYHRVGHPVYDYDLFKATSPLFHAEQINIPLFIAHGANDPITTLAESVQIVQALDALGVEVEFMVRWDEGHGFFIPQNRIEFYSVLEAFLAEHLGGRTSNRLEDLNYTQTLEEVLEVSQCC